MSRYFNLFSSDNEYESLDVAGSYIDTPGWTGVYDTDVILST